MNTFKYWVFISYAHPDAAIALRLKRKLEKLRIGAKLMSEARHKPAPETDTRIFLDQDDIVKDGTDLPDVIRKEIQASQKLIVICSPSSADARSHVSLELDAMIQAGRWQDIHPVIVGGDPRAVGNANDCFPAQLRNSYGFDGKIIKNNNPLSPDFRGSKPFKDEKEWANLLSGLLGVEREKIYNRSRKIRLRRNAYIAALVALMLSGVFWTVTYMQKSSAQRNLLQKREMVFDTADRMPAGRLEDAAKLILATWPKSPEERPWNIQIGFEVLSRFLTEFSLNMEILDTESIHTSKIVGISDDGARMLIAETGTAHVSLWNLFSKERISQFEVSDPDVKITSVKFSPDGKHIFIGTSQGVTIQMLVETPGETAQYEGHGGAVSSIQSSDSGAYILTTSIDDTFFVWNTETGEELLRFGSEEKPVSRAQISSDGNRVLVLPQKGSPEIWDITNGKVSLVLSREEDKTARSSAFSPDNTTAIVGYFDGTATVWDVETGEEIKSFNGNSEAIMDAFLSPDNSMAVTVNSNEFAQVWDVKTGKQLFGVQAVDAQFSSNGEMLLTRSWNEDITNLRVWFAKTGKEKLQLPHDDPVYFADFFPEASSIVTVTGSGVKVWSAGSDDEIRRLMSDPEYFRWGDFSLNQRKAIAVGVDGIIRLIDFQSDEIIQEFKVDKSLLTTATLSRDTSRMLTSSRQTHDDKSPYEYALWNTDTGERIFQLSGRPSRNDVVKFSPNGELLATSLTDAPEILIWDTRTGRTISQLIGHETNFSKAVFSQDGSLILAVTSDATVQVWDIETGRRIQAFDHELDANDGIMSAAFSNDLTRIATVSYLGDLRIRMVKDGTLVHSFHTTQSKLSSAIFSPDDKMILLTPQVGSAGLWSTETGEELLRFSPDKMLDYTSGLFLKDGAHLLLSSTDRLYEPSLSLWDVASGLEIKRLRGHTGPIHDARVTSDGHHLWTSSSDGSIRIWDIETIAENILEMACSSLPYLNGSRNTDVKNLQKEFPELSELIQEVPDCKEFADVSIGRKQ